MEYLKARLRFLRPTTISIPLVNQSGYETGTGAETVETVVEL